ncbi:DUF4126 family protein [Mycobacterium sp.]|uniref:DUF4126 family protein n=1 Tax=Mycobacterium sp. TaxID=1785 RepID=UPI0012757C05|nr:DUF4126 family protein [Mycobacterium sp.]KAA8964984.1 MAG: DUF4126 family protein [Mycobacterium sp.]
MTHLLVLLLALLIGVVAGLRSATAPAVIAWAALLHWINLRGTWVSWLDHPLLVTVLTALAVLELVADKLPVTPGRVATGSFLTRLVVGAFAGAVVGTAWGYPWGGLGAGVIGAASGTWGGHTARTRLTAARGGHDLPIALLEDMVAVLGGFAVAAMTAVV